MNSSPEIQKPAIGLLVSGIMLAVIALVTFVVSSSIVPETNRFMSSDDRLKVGLIRALVLIMVIFLVAMSVFTIIGANSMLKSRGHGIAMMGAICAIVGGVFSGLFGWILVLPMGIWALIVLKRPETKAIFTQRKEEAHTSSQ